MSNETTNPEIYGKKLSLTPENLATFEKFKKEIIKEEKNILKSITILNKLLLVVKELKSGMLIDDDNETHEDFHHISEDEKRANALFRN